MRIDPRVADVNSGHVARNRVVSSRFGLSWRVLVDFTLPLDAQVVLLAETGTGGELIATKDVFVFVSTRTDVKIIDRSVVAVAEFRELARQFGLEGVAVLALPRLVTEVVGLLTKSGLDLLESACPGLPHDAGLAQRGRTSRSIRPWTACAFVCRSRNARLATPGQVTDNSTPSMLKAGPLSSVASPNFS